MKLQTKLKRYLSKSILAKRKNLLKGTSVTVGLMWGMHLVFPAQLQIAAWLMIILLSCGILAPCVKYLKNAINEWND